MERQHVAYMDTIDEIVQGNWGCEFVSEDSAARQMVDDTPRLTAFALLAVLRRLNALAAAVGPAPPKQQREAPLEIPVYAGKFPDKQVGEYLYWGHIEEKIDKMLIVAKREDGVCLVVGTGFDFASNRKPHIYVAGDEACGTLEEAVRRAAESDMKFHKGHFESAQKALEAVERGDDLSEYLG